MSGRPRCVLDPSSSVRTCSHTTGPRHRPGPFHLTWVLEADYQPIATAKTDSVQTVSDSAAHRRVASEDKPDLTRPGASISAEDQGLTHIDATGRARMVDVTSKPWTRRRALARCRVDVGEPTMRKLSTAGDIPPTIRDPSTRATTGVRGATPESIGWAEVLGGARLAGIQAAKQTPTLIPLCHPLTVSSVEVRLSLGRDCVHIEGVAEVIGPTGVEMEALSACSVAALTVAAAVHPIAPTVAINDLGLWEKSGGRSGTWRREPRPESTSG